MPLKNTSQGYGILARILHWGIALLIIALLAVGLIMTGLPNDPDKFKIYGLHKSTGILVLMLVAFRFVWRQLNVVPKLPDTLSRSQKILAHLGHWGLYGLMFLMPLSGWAMSSAAGFPVAFYGLFVLPDFVSPDKPLRHLMGEVHEYAAYTLMALLAAHIVAALLHHFHYKDDVLKRMWRGPVPMAVALTIFFMAGMSPAAEIPTWKMLPDKSSLTFTARQNDAPVKGNFKQFDAEIQFDPEHLKESHIRVVVKIGGLSMNYEEAEEKLRGDEWFAATSFPQATFISDEIAKTGEKEYVAHGKLTIRDVTQPMDVNFVLKEYTATKALAEGHAELSRKAFSLGWDDTTVVADKVKIDFVIEATR